MKTLEDVRKAAEAVELRDSLLYLIEKAGEDRLTDQKAFGVPISIELSDRLRGLVVDDLLQRLAETEAALRAMGVLLPGDPAPDVEPFVAIICVDGIEEVAADFERARPACQAADDGNQVAS